MEELHKVASVFLIVAVFQALSVHHELFILFPWLICTIQKFSELDATHSWPGENSLQ